MSIVGDRMNLNKPAPPAPDPKTGKVPVNNKDLDVDPKKDEPSLFGSFIFGSKSSQRKKGAPVMETVSFCVVVYGVHILTNKLMT